MTVGEELDVDGLPRYPSWELFRRAGTGAALAPEGREASLWALDVLERYLGTSWPRRQFQQRGWVPGFLLGYAGWRHDLPRLLTLACNVDRFRETKGADQLRRLVSNTAESSAWRHFCLQLETARAATHVGEVLSFEPAIDGTTRAGDVEVALGRATHVVEVTSVSRSDADLGQEDFERRLRRAVEATAWREGVAVEVELRTIDVSENDVTSWLASVQASCAFVARTGAAQRDSRGFPALLVSPASHDEAVGPGLTKFSGAVYSRDAWLRTRDALRDKARQTIGASRAWLRMDCVDGLFALTDWAQHASARRVEEMTHNVRLALTEFEHLNGVVMSGGAGAWLGAAHDQAWEERVEVDGAVLLRRLTSPGLARETVVVPLIEEGGTAAQMWVQSYDEEARWLHNDLASRGWSLDRMRAQAP